MLRKWGPSGDLAKQFDGKGPKGVGIKLIPRRFYDPALTRYCRHELMHINDMLDPAFGYDPIPGWDRIPARKRSFCTAIAFLEYQCR